MAVGGRRGGEKRPVKERMGMRGGGGVVVGVGG